MRYERRQVALKLHDVDFSEFLLRFQPDDLSLVSVYLKSILGHPFLNLFYAAHERAAGSLCIRSWGTHKHLGVIRVNECVAQSLTHTLVYSAV